MYEAMIEEETNCTVPILDLDGFHDLESRVMDHHSFHKQNH